MSTPEDRMRAQLQEEEGQSEKQRAMKLSLKNRQRQDWFPVKVIYQGATNADDDAIWIAYKTKFPQRRKSEHLSENESGQNELNFTSKPELLAFIQDLSQNRNFIISDAKTMKVMAYAYNGKLYHAGGNEFQHGDKLKKSEIDHADFIHPALNEAQRTTPRGG